MFNQIKNNINELLEEISEINNKIHIIPSLCDRLKDLERKNSILNAEIFKIKYPNGLLDSTYLCCSFNRSCVYKYSYDNYIKEVELCGLNKEYTRYKISINENKIYIGLDFDNEHRYFIVDISSNTSIEYTNGSIINGISWLKR